MQFFRQLSLSRKILLGIVPLFLLFISISVVLDNRFQEKEMMDQAQRSAETYAAVLKESLVNMMVNNLEVDSSFLERVNMLPQFDTVHVLINNLKLRKELLTPKRQNRLETKYKTLVAHDEIEKNVLMNGEPIFLREGNRFRGVVPFQATAVCQQCHAVPVDYTLGAVDIHISLEQVVVASADNWKRSLLIFLVFTALAITVASLMFTTYVSRPVDRLVTATREISAGNLQYAITTTQGDDTRNNSAGSSRDELMFLAARFDEMRLSLKEKIDELDQANASLSERNKEVEETLRRLRQAQEDLVRSERLAVTGKMTGQLSHEINNPIHNIQSLLETSLRKIDGSSQAKELIGVAIEEVARMARLTKQMLDFYRGSVVDVELEQVDMRDVLAEFKRTNEEPLSRQQIAMVVDAPPSLPPIRGSRDKLKQVLLNLLINARDAMPDGGMITVRARALHRMLRIDFSDTGVGIRPEHTGRVFDAFFTTKKELSGVGLGLSVSYGIVQQHGGMISVASKLDEGTTFTIQLPCAGETHA